MQEYSAHPGPESLKALAHPVRLRMLGLLRSEGPATATSLADRLGLNSGATSYHLRQLARHGFIADDLERGNGRERWWRAEHRSTHFPSTAVTEEERDAIDAFVQAVAVIQTARAQHAAERIGELEPGWRAASTTSDWELRLTAGQAQALVASIEELVGRVAEQHVTSDDPAAESFVIQLQAFPGGDL